jgi:hypothetical protein
MIPALTFWHKNRFRLGRKNFPETDWSSKPADYLDWKGVAGTHRDGFEALLTINDSSTQPLDASFRAKVLVPVVACMIGAMVIVFFMVNYRVSEQSEMEARNTLTTASAVIGYSQELRWKNLLLRFHNLPNEPLWGRCSCWGSAAPCMAP